MSDLREKVAAKLAETIYDWENTHRTTTRAMTDDEFIQYSSEVLADAAISICMEEAAKATCSSCAKGWPLNDFGYHVPPKGYSTWPCHAAAIRSLKGGGDG